MVFPVINKNITSSITVVITNYAHAQWSKQGASWQVIGAMQITRMINNNKIMIFLFFLMCVL